MRPRSGASRRMSTDETGRSPVSGDPNQYPDPSAQPPAGTEPRTDGLAASGPPQPMAGYPMATPPTPGQPSPWAPPAADASSQPAGGSAAPTAPLPATPAQ